MLALTRMEGERIMVGNDIVFTIVHIKGDRVVVGVDAPKDIPVHREEIYDLIRRNEEGKK